MHVFPNPVTYMHESTYIFAYMYILKYIHIITICDIKMFVITHVLYYFKRVK